MNWEARSTCRAVIRNWEKHGVESVFIRIGSAFPEPVDARMLATWLSYDDLRRLIARCVLAGKVECAVIWGTSKNARMTWWGKDARTHCPPEFF
jgi:uronate dehydrogenase